MSSDQYTWLAELEQKKPVGVRNTKTPKPMGMNKTLTAENHSLRALYLTNLTQKLNKKKQKESHSERARLRFFKNTG